MRVLVCGGRDYGNLARCEGGRSHPDWPQKEWEYRHIMATLNRLSLDWPRLPEDEYGNWLPDVFIMSGGAPGVDSVAIDWAVVNWCRGKKYKAEWNKYGGKAGPIRNKRMLEDGKPDVVIAFPGGSGTANMVMLAKRAGVPVIEISAD